MNAVKRVEGYCCKVTEKQWEQLVEAADQTGVPVESVSRENGTEHGDFPYVLVLEDPKELFTFDSIRGKLISFDSFLAKLRGEQELPHIGRDTSLHTQKVEDVLVDAEPWTPKTGDDVWFKFHATGAKHRGVFITPWNGKDIIWDISSQSPVVAFGPIENVPHYTKAEAEKKFNIVITDT